jgi:hypothetical protein
MNIGDGTQKQDDTGKSDTKSDTSHLSTPHAALADAHTPALAICAPSMAARQHRVHRYTTITIAKGTVECKCGKLSRGATIY